MENDDIDTSFDCLSFLSFYAIGLKDIFRYKFNIMLIQKHL